MGVELKSESPYAEQLDKYFDSLLNSGLRKSTANIYTNHVIKFLNAGNELNKECINNYLEKMRENNEANYRLSAAKRALNGFYDFLNGKPFVKKFNSGRLTRRGIYKGCDEDCFNCQYPDCLKPSSLCISEREVAKNLYQ